MPKFSVVISLYNKAEYVERAVRSVLVQTVKDLELIVVDDGSTDGSGDVVESIKDDRIRLLRKGRAGECAARNSGITISNSGWIAFLDADDEWDADFLFTVSRLIQEFPDAGAFATDYRIVKSAGISRKARIRGVPAPPWEGVLPDFFMSAYKGELPLTASSVCVSKDVFRDTGMFPEGAKLGGDIDMWIRLAMRYPIIFSTDVCVTYHHDAESRACEVLLPEELPFEKGLRKAMEEGEFTGTRAGYAEKFISKCRYLSSVKYLLAGNKKDTRRWLKGTRGGVNALKILLVYILSFMPREVVSTIWKIRKKFG